MKQRILLIVTLCLLAFGASAQYNFTEIGFRVGGGTNLPIFGSGFKTGGAYNANAFFTHFRCGKRDGYHIEAGFRGFTVSESRPENSPSLLGIDKGGDLSYHFLYAELGAYYKIRATKHNTLKEIALMIGPKVNFNLMKLGKQSGGSFETLSNNAYRNVGVVIPGIHLSLHMRRMLDKFHYLFIIPGVEWYFLQTASTDTNIVDKPPRFSNLYLFLNVGMTFRLKKSF